MVPSSTLKYFFSNRYETFVDELKPFVESKLEITDFYTIQDELFEMLVQKKNYKDPQTVK